MTVHLWLAISIDILIRNHVFGAVVGDQLSQYRNSVVTPSRLRHHLR